MKKFSIFIICLVVLLAITGNAFAMNTPVVVKNHGVITALITGGGGFTLGVEYGLTPNLAVTGGLNSDLKQLGLKYELNREFALLGGVTDNSAPYIGINGARRINSSVTGLFEAGLASGGSDFSLMYKLGAKVDLYRAFGLRTRDVDLRGGLVGSGNSKFPDIAVGIGFSF